jgi:RNA polymerase sigma-70 factor (ECF subfamily)
VASGKLALFEGLRPYLVGAGDAPSYRAAAADLGVSEGAVKVAVHRLRRRFAEALRADIAETVAGTDEVDAELRFLMATFQ